jgi:hypothetical protein
MIEAFRETPESKREAFDHPVGQLSETGRTPSVIPLEAVEVERIKQHVPSDEDCNLISSVFRRLRGETRNAAYHLLWFARELSQGREPITQDKL